MAVADLHPNPAELEAFALGTLDDAAQANVAAHLATCPSCQERAATTTNDTLVELLRRVHSKTTSQEKTARPEATLRAGSVSDGSGAASSVAYASGSSVAGSNDV